MFGPAVNEHDVLASPDQMRAHIVTDAAGSYKSDPLWHGISFFKCVDRLRCDRPLHRHPNMLDARRSLALHPQDLSPSLLADAVAPTARNPVQQVLPPSGSFAAKC